MRSFIVNFILENQTQIVQKWINDISQQEHGEEMSRMSSDDYKNTNREFIELIVNNTGHNEQAITAGLKPFAERLIKLGWPLSYIIKGLQTFRGVILEILYTDGANQADPLTIVREVNDWIDPIINNMTQNYAGLWEDTVSLQKVALQELSSPLIPLLEGITVMPLIGTIDTERARMIMENLLAGVVKHRSEVVLIDITGVPIVDTMVAHHIIQAVEAVRLIGSQAILVGIRPEIAQTIVNLGIDLSHLPTKSSMKKGIEAALQHTNRKIVEID